MKLQLLFRDFFSSRICAWQFIQTSIHSIQDSKALQTSIHSIEMQKHFNFRRTRTPSLTYLLTSNVSFASSSLCLFVCLCMFGCGVFGAFCYVFCFGWSSLIHWNLGPISFCSLWIHDSVFWFRQ